MKNEQKQTELLEYYRAEHTKATFSGYKQHYRQLIMLMEIGRTIADGKTIVLDDQLLNNLWFAYQTHTQIMTAQEMGRKGGAKSKGGGRPPKPDADPKRRERYLKNRQ